MPYLGAVVKLSSKDEFQTMEWVIKNLPVSGFDHTVNGLDFLHDGRLIVAVGGMTNAGYPSVKYGTLNEQYLSSAIIAADVRKPDFNGNVQYKLLDNTPEAHPFTGSKDGRDPENQRWGDWAYKTDDDDITLFATGTRNAFDVYVTPAMFVYATDNGPNSGFGGAVSHYDEETQNPGLRPDSKKDGGLEVDLQDEINLIKEGSWYGHPNVARYRQDPVKYEYESEWYSQRRTAGIPDIKYVPPLATHSSPSEALVYYRAETFGGASRGWLYVDFWKQGMVGVELD